MLRVALACAALVILRTLVAPAACRGEPPQRLNIVLVCTDDQRWDTLGCLGNGVIETPHIDALARQGLVYENSFVTTSICAISRASLFTGQYARRHGIHDFATPLSEEQFAKSYPGLLKQAGYRLGFVGKWGVGNKLPADKFDVWHGFPGQGQYFARGDDEHLNRKMARQALGFLEGCRDDQPFCLQVSLKAAHCQDGAEWEFPTEADLRSRYENVQVPVPPTATERHYAALPAMLQSSEARRRWERRFKTPEMHQKTVKDYYRLITGADRVVGEIVDKVASRGWLDRTLIIFTSDNGFYLGDHGLAGKWFAHEPSIRVPLVIYDPRLPKEERGKRVADWALNIDIAPTILAAAGVVVPDTIQGIDLLSPQQAERRAARREFYYEHPFRHAAIPFVEGIRGERWKYVRYEQRGDVVEQLFDLKDDPHEERDRAAEPEQADRLEQMRARLERYRQEVR